MTMIPIKWHSRKLIHVNVNTFKTQNYCPRGKGNFVSFSYKKGIIKIKETLIIIIPYSCFNKTSIFCHFSANCPFNFLWYQLILYNIFQGSISEGNCHQKSGKIYTFWEWEWCLVSAPKMVKQVPWYMIYNCNCIQVRWYESHDYYNLSHI